MKKLIILLFASFIIPFVSAVENINEEYSVDDNTIALWHFNEGEGDRVYDETENNNDGTIRDNFDDDYWRQDGRFGGTLDFNEENHSILVPYQRILIPENLTLEAWVYRDSDSDGIIIAKNGPYYLSIVDNKIRAGVYTEEDNGARWDYAEGQTEISLNEWHHVSMTYDGAHIRIYLDGAENGSIEKNGSIVVTNQALYIGWGEPGLNWYFDGKIDEVRISNIARFYNEEEPEEEDEELTLEERFNILEQQMEELNNRTTSLENTVNDIQERLNDIIEKVIFYLTYSPRWDRRDTVCAYMRSNNINNYTALGLRCEIRGRSCRCVDA